MFDISSFMLPRTLQELQEEISFQLGLPKRVLTLVKGDCQC